MFNKLHMNIEQVLYRYITGNKILLSYVLPCSCCESDSSSESVSWAACWSSLSCSHSRMMAHSHSSSWLLDRSTAHINDNHLEHSDCLYELKWAQCLDATHLELSGFLYELKWAQCLDATHLEHSGFLYELKWAQCLDATHLEHSGFLYELKWAQCLDATHLEHSGFLYEPWAQCLDATHLEHSGFLYEL